MVQGLVKLVFSSSGRIETSHLRLWLGILLMLATTVSASGQATDSIADWCRALKSVDRFGAGHPAAQQAVRQLSEVSPSEIPEILVEMQGANPLAANWFRAAIESVRDSDPDALPMSRLQAFLLDRSQSPQARSLAFDLIVTADPSQRESLIGQFRNDPSLELRYLAIDQGLQAAADLRESGRSEQAVALYQTLLNDARNPTQVDAIAKALADLGQPVDLTQHFGFLTDWSLVGPFDNTDKVGFDTAYPPESEVNLTATYEGKDGPVSWSKFSTTADLGIVDLNEALGKAMGAVAYATTEFNVDEPMTVDIRLGSPNGNKVWVNGQLVLANHVYHAGDSVDQYIGQVELRPGANQILVKICQNEQTESWAQDWKFQLRVTDALGKKVVPSSR